MSYKSVNFLNATAELNSWFSRRRSELCCDIRVETHTQNEKDQINRAGLAFYSKNLICSLAVLGTGYGNRDQKLYGEIEYIVIDNRLPMKNALRSDNAFVANQEELKNKLDKFLNDFNNLVFEKDCG